MKLGVIGLGNMGTAIVKGYIAGGADVKKIFVMEQDPGRRAAFAEETGVTACESIGELTEKSDILLIAVKPKDVPSVIAQTVPHMTEDKIISCIAAGMTVARLRACVVSDAEWADRVKIVRIMPNTPAMVGTGMSALCRSESVKNEEFEFVLDIFRSIGLAEEVPESLMDAVTGVSGSGPAFVYLFIEALADGAVLEGLPRDQAVKFAAQTVLGGAKMVLETGRHPGDLKDAVCSPAGTTIEGVRALEAGGFRHAAMSAVIAAAEKSRNM